jgi:hypothetical protein
MIREIFISDYMNGYDIAGIPESRGYVSYLHPSLIFFNVDTLPNKDDMNLFGGNVEGFDTDIGGHLYYWLESNKGLRVRNIISSGQICSANKNLILLPKEMEDNDYQFEILDKTFIHHGAGSRWDGKGDEFYKNKGNCLENFLKVICAK